MVLGLNNREISMLIWVSVIIIYALRSKDVRKSIGGVLQMFFSKFFLTVFGIVIGYQIGILYLLHKVSIWNFDNLKDTILWFFGSACILLFSVNKIKVSGEFKGVVKAQFKWVVLLEFIVQIFVFSFWVEFFIVPILIVFSMLSGFIEAKSKYENTEQYTAVYKFSQSILLIIGVLFTGYAVYKTIGSYVEVFTMRHFLDLILPILLTILFIPLVYCFALLMIYETLFLFLSFHIKNKAEHRAVKFAIIKKAMLNLNKLSNIDGVIRKNHLWKSGSIFTYLREGRIEPNTFD